MGHPVYCRTILCERKLIPEEQVDKAVVLKVLLRPAALLTSPSPGNPLEGKVLGATLNLLKRTLGAGP